MQEKVRSLVVSCIIYLTLILSVNAQELENEGNASYTLQACISYALQNSPITKNAELSKENAKAKVREMRAQGLPQLNAKVDATYNFISSEQLIPQKFTDKNNASDDFIAIQFVPDYNTSAEANLNQLIFDGTYFVGLKSAKTYRELSEKEHIKSKIDVIEAVMKAYYTVLVNKEHLVSINGNFNRLRTLLEETTIIYQNGFAEKVDVDRISVQYNNMVVEKKKVENLLEISYDLLKFQMGMPLSQPLTLADNISAIDLDYKITREVDYEQRIEYAILSTNKELAKLAIKHNKVQYLPKLGGFAKIGASAGSNKLSDLAPAGDRWLANGVVGINLSIPLFDGLMKSARIQQRKIALAQIDSELVNLKNSIDLQRKEASVNFKTSLERLEVQKENLELAKEVFRISNVKYKEGMGANLEVINAEQALKEAEVNYYSALYEALINKVELDKATGKLLENEVF